VESGALALAARRCCIISDNFSSIFPLLRCSLPEHPLTSFSAPTIVCHAFRICWHVYKRDQCQAIHGHIVSRSTAFFHESLSHCKRWARFVHSLTVRKQHVCRPQRKSLYCRPHSGNLHSPSSTKSLLLKMAQFVIPNTGCGLPRPSVLALEYMWSLFGFLSGI
jgi:hypothetical protein